MKKLVVLVVCLLCIGCISPGTKIKLTDSETGNSVTVSEDGLEVDVKTMEKDDIVVEVEDDKADDE